MNNDKKIVDAVKLSEIIFSSENLFLSIRDLNLPDDRIYMTKKELAKNTGNDISKISEKEYLSYLAWTGAL